MWNTDLFWQEYSIVVETAYINTLKVEKEVERQLRGHGKLVIKQLRRGTDAIIVLGDDTYIGRIDPGIHRNRMQLRRCRHLAQTIMDTSSAETGSNKEWHATNVHHHTLEALTTNVDTQHSFECDINQISGESETNNIINYGTTVNSSNK